MAAEGEKPEHELDMWVRELLEAGWRRYQIRGRVRSTIWVAPDGSLYRGPFGAWQMMKSQKEWESRHVIR